MTAYSLCIRVIGNVVLGCLSHQQLGSFGDGTSVLSPIQKTVEYMKQTIIKKILPFNKYIFQRSHDSKMEATKRTNIKNIQYFFVFKCQFSDDSSSKSKSFLVLTLINIIIAFLTKFWSVRQWMLMFFLFVFCQM